VDADVDFVFSPSVSIGVHPWLLEAWYEPRMDTDGRGFVFGFCVLELVGGVERAGRVCEIPRRKRRG
jgi:hypothetical protein